MRKAAVALSLAVGLTVASLPAAAQPAEPQQLAQAIVHDMAGSVDFSALATRGMRNATPNLGPLADSRPEWATYTQDAMREEMVNARPIMERILAARVAKAFTVEELKAGRLIMADPSVQAGIGRAVAGKPANFNGCTNACMQAVQAPAGRRFMQKFGDTEKLFGKDAVTEFTAAMMPGFLRRMADKIEAGEKRRAGGG